MALETLPPYRHIASRPISLADASKMLDKYIANSERHPHLHPDALITPSGVTFSSHGGPTGGVVMHNLRRVAAGLRGEYLEPEPERDSEEQEQESEASSWKGKGKKTKDADTADATQNDWQDMSEFEREEAAIEVGEIGRMVHIVQEGGDAPEVEVTGEEQGTKKRKNGGDGDDKNARKAAKKARLKEQRAEKEKARAGKSKSK
ncbi:hypothetical protein K458DRAFT_419098 [Lentithecium fluviatile CBS 122367]|uniref:Uncharacterized protein n=1 Tax=Lentithecium fluviatile CBS 122367 TaxID=1168545 RepID=A0A6G1IZ27_9PLEO|nr:hypothetical protein K458DRAFT_419098 [Lentithecium fluviatile CBS 122367]